MNGATGTIVAADSDALELPREGCGCIPPRSAGIWSFVLQVVTILTSSAVIVFFYIFINGQPTKDGVSRILDGQDWNFNVIDEVGQILNKNNETTEQEPLFAHQMLNNDTSDALGELTNATLNFGNEYRIEILRLIIFSTFGNLMVNFFAILTSLLLLLSVKLEIRDLVFLNSELLGFSALFHLIHAVLIASLLFYLKTVHWQMILISSSIAAVLILCIISHIIACYFNWVWLRYIAYSNGHSNCVIWQKIKSICRPKRRSGNADFTVEYAETNNVRQQSDVGYIDQDQIRNEQIVRPMHRDFSTIH